MKSLEAVAIILVIALAVSIYFNYALYTNVQQLNLAFNNLNQSYYNLNQSYSQLNDDLNHYNNMINQNSPFSTPVSKSQAIRIALDYGGWNATTLSGMGVSATLQYRAFEQTPISYGHWVINDVTEPVANYSAVQNGAITYRYIWQVVVEPNQGLQSIPPPGLYFVDAASGEIVPTGVL